MSEVYNPESVIREHLESLELEARALVRKRDAAPPGDHRRVLERLLSEVEARVAALRRRLRR